MRKRVGWFSMILALSLLLGACGSNSANNGNTNKGNESSAPAASNEANKANETPYELTVAFITFGNTPADIEQVQAEISKLAQEKINATVKLLPIAIGSWNQQMNLMLTSNEKLDLIVTGSSPTFGYGPQVAKGQLLPLDDLVSQYGQDIKSAVGEEFMKASNIGGKIYGIPSIRDLAVNYGVLMRKDIADKYNIDMGAMKSLDDLEAAMKIIKAGEPNTAVIAPGTAGRSIVDYLMGDIDMLGDSFGVLLNNGSDLKVVNWYETPQYAELVKRVRGWYNAGYILKDAATNKESIGDLIKGQRTLAYVANLKPGVESQESRLTGTEIVRANLTEPLAKTETVTNIMWALPRNSSNPERAMQFLNLMYSDKQIINLFDWGIEGKHYVKTATDNVIKYPDGVDATNSGYNLNMGWLFGNQFLSHTFEGDDPDIWNKLDEFNKSAIKSKALGFTFDTTSVKTEYAAVVNVVNQNKLGLETGTLDPDKTLPDFISKLKAAGIDKIIAEKQKQLDAWASKK